MSAAELSAVQFMYHIANRLVVRKSNGTSTIPVLNPWRVAHGGVVGGDVDDGDAAAAAERGAVAAHSGVVGGDVYDGDAAAVAERGAVATGVRHVVRRPANA